jgi:hypothetical protein
VTTWYVDRAAGLVSWVLLAGSMVLGLLLSSKALGRRVRPAWLQDLHRGVSGLAVAFVGVHVAAAIADDHIHVGLAEVLVPFTSSWRPWAIAWGVVSTYLLVAIEATSLLRTHLPRRLWHRIHLLSLPLFATATAHGITAGTDLATTASIAVASLATALVAGLTALRVMEAVDRRSDGSGAPPRRAATASMAAVATPAASATAGAMSHRGTGPVWLPDETWAPPAGAPVGRRQI